MADAFNNEINVGPPPVTLPKRRSFGPLGIIVVLLILGGGGGYLWLNYREALTDMVQAVTGSTGSRDGAPVLASAAEGGVSATDFAAFQQQTGSSIQAATELLTAQQAELKRLSDQIQGLTTQVVGLTAKIDALQGRGVLAPPAPAAVPTAPVAAVPAAPVAARPAPTAPRKRPADRPAGAISVGGAPLPTAQPPR
ncbi:hypothetical protein [Tardiphaga sp.]|uniref:hypothetical protein n=1 Tax=Tardiphaga sp. TaxID=1926292 RepID=UPI003529E26E